MKQPEVQELLRRVRADVAVGPAPIEQVLLAGTRRRRRARTAWSVAGVALLVLAIVSTLAFVGLHRTPRQPVTTLNAIGMPWWGNGELRLLQKTIVMAEPELMVQVPDGVVV